MYSRNTIIFEYEQLLTGERLNFSTRNQDKIKCIFDGSVEDRRKTGGVIWAYAVEHILHWTPEQAAELMNSQIMKALKLDKTLTQMEIEHGQNVFLDNREILKYAFPGKIKYDIAAQARTEYRRVMKLDEFEHEKKNHKFHKGFFFDDGGMARTRAVVGYAIERFMGNVTDFELYLFFGTDEANAWCNSHRIGRHDIPGYSDPLELLHYSLPEGDSDKLLYVNERLRQIYRNKLRKERQEETEKKAMEDKPCSESSPDK